MDRGLASHAWISRFVHGRVRHLAQFSSDHTPLFLDWAKRVDRHDGLRRFGPKPFRFEAFWSSDDECAAVIGNSWRAGQQLKHAIDETGKELRSWRKVRFSKRKGR